MAANRVNPARRNTTGAEAGARKPQRGIGIAGRDLGHGVLPAWNDITVCTPALQASVALPSVAKKLVQNSLRACMLVAPLHEASPKR